MNNYEVLDRKQCGINNTIVDNNSVVLVSDNRGIDSGFDTIEETANLCTNNERNSESVDCSINVKIYRYKFSDDFIEELYKFSKIHQYDHRKDFKEAWELWIDDNSSLVLQESARLTDLGYDGDVLNKMFTSARYYFRKKGTEKKEPRMRCTYVGIQKELLDAMDNHININLKQSWYKPSTGFTEFCKGNIDLLQQEIELLIKHNVVASDEIRNKIKKTYKNRYFMIINKKN
jgi:hypothetical protein